MTSRAERNIRWIETHCVIPEGKDVGKPVRLRDWQKSEIRKVYDNPAGTRTAIISFAKKNAKTTMAAFLLLLHLVGPEARPNTQLPSTAQSQEQAAVIFELAAKMVRMSPTLMPEITIRDHKKQLYCPELGTLYKALSADASTAHGQSPAFAVHDELGQVKGPRSELYNAIENAMGAHENPLSIVISTQAPTDNDLLSILIDDALAGHDPRIVVSLYTADPELDPFSEEAIRQANPAFGDFLNAEEVLKQASDAKRMPAQEALYRNYTLNQRVEASNPFVTKSVWDANKGAPSFGPSWYGGLDLSEVNDLTSLKLISLASDGTWGVESRFWLPEEGLEERSRKDRVPYDVWAKEGLILTTPGRTVEYEYVAKEIAKLFDTRDIRKIAFDRYNMRHLRPWLIHAGLPEALIDDRFVDFGQGYFSMSPALRNLESLLLAERIRHGGHPVLTMCAANAVVKTDEAGNRKLDKKKSRGRIDGMVSLAMACEVANANATEPEPAVFHVEQLQSWSSPPSGGNRYLLVSSPHDKRPDVTAMIAIEARNDRTYCVLEMVRDRMSVSDRIDTLFELHRRHDPLRVSYDKRGYEGDQGHIRDLQDRENYRFRVDPVSPSLTDNERILRLVPLVDQKRIVLPQSQIRDGVDMAQIFRDQEMAPYPYGAQHDLLFCLSMILDTAIVFPAVKKTTVPAVFPSEW